MNGRVAKELRSRAEMVTIGQPPLAYERRMLGKSPTGTIILGQCTRKAYKGLKRLFRAGVISVECQRVVKSNREAVQE